MREAHLRPRVQFSWGIQSACLTDLLVSSSTPLHYSCLGNPMDGGAWWAAVHEVTKSQTRLSDFTFTFHFHALEKEMATHSSVLAWRIPGTAEPGGLPSMGSHRVRHDWRDLAAAAAPPREWADTAWPKAPTINHIVSIGCLCWPRAPHKQKHTYWADSPAV